MIFDPPLAEAVLRRRYKRFLADLELPGGETLTVHVPNTGAMTLCAEPGSRAWYSTSDDPRRKLAGTLEIVESAGALAGVNTARTNALVEEALAAGRIPELAGYGQRRREVRSGDSRLDFLLEGAGPPAWVEVKNVTLVDGAAAIFPDAVTARGLKHVERLRALEGEGARAVLLFVVQREDADHFRPAAAIDPAYARALAAAHAEGVEILCYQARVSPREICLRRALPVVVD
ncbi:MAG TPA: DNA/RNA nuclease SfsA [Acidobacteria bacterium]|nr:DNA/RNA nuclease SfsA [Acidobacteriota bacterium]